MLLLYWWEGSRKEGVAKLAGTGRSNRVIQQVFLIVLSHGVWWSLLPGFLPVAEQVWFQSGAGPAQRPGRVFPSLLSSRVAFSLERGSSVPEARRRAEAQVKYGEERGCWAGRGIVAQEGQEPKPEATGKKACGISP